MSEQARNERLKLAMLVIGALFTIGFYPMAQVWPNGWAWHPEQSPYLTMLLGVYMTLGACLMAGSRNPAANASLINFTIWSSMVHGCILAVQSAVFQDNLGHFYGEVPALFCIAAILLYLRPASIEDNANANAKATAKASRATSN